MRLTAEQCVEMFSSLPLETQEVVVCLCSELQEAETKHPKWPEDLIHAAAIVSEEAGELIQAALEKHYENGTYHRMIAEAVQTGAMAIRFLKNLPKEL